MISKIKTFIGLQSLQVEAFIRKEKPKPDLLFLTLKWSAGEARTLTGFQLLLKEEYSRGRWTGKYRQTFQIGEFKQEGRWSVQPEQPFLINVDIPFFPMVSHLDRLQGKLILSPLISGVKWLENVRSSYYLEVTTTIQGAALASVRRIDLPGLVPTT